MKYIIAIVLISLFIVGCRQDMTIAVEDLSRATPLVVQENSGSSHIKIIDEQPVDEFDETTLEKRVYREGDLITFDPIGVDPDGDVITYSFSRPLDEKGRWQTEIGDTGTYQVTIRASDGKTEVEKRVIILVLSANRAPTIENFDDIAAKEGDLVILDPKIFDYNSDELVIGYSKPFDADGQWQTDYDDSGTYVVKLSVSDNETTVEKQITIVVEDMNRPPVLEPISPVTVLSGDTVSLVAVASDPDSDAVSIFYSDPLDSEGIWVTDTDDVGTYAVTVTASDGIDTAEKLVTIVVNHRNLAPVISIDEVRAEETDRIVLQPVIVDPEADSFIVVYDAPFDVDGIWVTDYDDAGQYDVVISATDDQGNVGTVVVKIVIYDRNRAPTFTI